ncbi:hypothetical protein D9M69_679560 [compost metagenome]
MAGRIFVAHAKQCHIHALGLEKVGEPLEISGFARILADPEEIGVHHQNGPIGQLLQTLDQATTRIHQCVAFVGNDDFWRRALRQMRFHLIGEVVHVDGRRRDTGVCK